MSLLSFVKGKIRYIQTKPDVKVVAIHMNIYTFSGFRSCMNDDVELITVRETLEMGHYANIDGVPIYMKRGTPNEIIEFDTDEPRTIRVSYSGK